MRASQAVVPDGSGVSALPVAIYRLRGMSSVILTSVLSVTYHHKLRARERLDLTVDEGSFVEIDANVTSLDPLCFPEYADKIGRARAKTGLVDAILTGYAKIEGQPTIIGAADFSFMGGSMGSVVGEKIVRAMNARLTNGCQSRYLRQTEEELECRKELLSLMQMAKTSAAVARLDRESIPYIVVLTDPTMAGVYASFASLGDIILAEPRALIGFAGRRVGNQDVGAKLPDDFQTAEFQLRCGMVDRVVPRKELRSVLGKMLRFTSRRAD